MTNQQPLTQAQYLVMMLERLSADSFWAHQASGVRGAILRSMDAIEGSGGKEDQERLQNLIALGYEILELAAKEIPAVDNK